MFHDLFISFFKVTLCRRYKLDKFALFDFVLPGDTSDFQNSSYKVGCKINQKLES